MDQLVSGTKYYILVLTISEVVDYWADQSKHLIMHKTTGGVPEIVRLQTNKKYYIFSWGDLEFKRSKGDISCLGDIKIIHSFY